MKQKGKLIVISAPSGCGKTTIVDRLLERNRNITRSISYTTRSPRAGELNERDYFFISESDFLEKRKKHFFLESADVFGHHYGTSREFVTDCINDGRDVVLAIDVQGMKQIKEKADRDLPVVSIFIMPPSLDDLKQRLENRKTETKGQIEERLRMAEDEMAERRLYDFVVVNQDVSEAVKSIEGIVK